MLGSFRRGSNGDWDFVLGGKGCTGGLEELVQDFGVEVEQIGLSPDACPPATRRWAVRTA